MRRGFALFASLTLLGAGCLEIEEPPPPPPGSSLTGRVLVVGSQGKAAPDVERALRRTRHAAARLSRGERVHAQDLVGTDDAARFRPTGRPGGASALGGKQQMRWRGGEVIVLMSERGRFDKPALYDVVVDMLARAGHGDVVPAVASCTLRQFCLVTLDDDAGKRLDEAKTEQVAKALHDARAPGVKTVARNFAKSALRVPNDPYYVYQWHYDFARLPAAWDISTGDPSVVVAVVDSGLKSQHPDIVSRVVQGADLISDPGVAGDGNGRDPDPTDPGDNALGNGQSSWHGTHVAGTIAAETDNGEGVSGILWQGRLQPVRVLGMGAQGFDFDILSGVAWAVGSEDVEDVPRNLTPAKVVNLSLGGPADQQGRQVWVDLIDIITNQSAAAFGFPILVTAAGNDNQTVEGVVPGNIPAAITVGATRYDGQRAEYSNWGPSVDIMAPGGQASVDQNLDGFPDGVLSLYDNDYNFEQGTSMAAPHVTGIVALAVSVNPNLDQASAQQLLRDTANPAGACNEGCGTGHVDAAAALLGAGGVVAGAPRLAVDVTRLVFQPGISQAGFHVLNIGSAELSWTAEVIGPQAQLFSISQASGTLAAGGSVAVSVDLSRADFGAGSANLQFRGLGDADGQLVNVDLSFNDQAVPVQTNLQAVAVGAYRVVEDGALEQAGDLVYARRDSEFAWKIAGLEPGDYYVFAVGDDNNDGNFDAQRESFGAWPVASNPAIIPVEANTEYTQVNFGLSGGFSLNGEGVVGAPCVSNLDCTFAADAECITDWPGGYCSRICDDGLCGAGASCEELDCNGPCNVCLTACSSNGQCRADEGFVCDPYGTCTPSGL